MSVLTAKELLRLFYQLEEGDKLVFLLDVYKNEPHKCLYATMGPNEYKFYDPSAKREK